MPDSDAKRLIRPTGEYCFVTAGWRREASYPVYGGYCFVTAGWRWRLSGLRTSTVCRPDKRQRHPAFFIIPSLFWISLR
ncbi:hypothetical protein DO259_15225 [Salmonella enterica]|nr:hypothetical protein [Salmonella enterica]EBY5451168.1 hypothetical protein [Salmonella enterica subsp. enterica serovar Curacao]